ncbi:glycosyltransferase involved in cell wall biosynthesis [Kibdelosporangium banguiense]|uniref:Glycosyltransferase involved in cell wall biosynthesis n=1 Tax=Kibdelosporangium banguiense TaxID=1365924 RepID=A0ABS4T8B1_9PSEU|nr:GT4 family glycosyltransferase PelF [Kibdelosporangium banguiense]MBP2320667.1 glycosyltransferase involved in cell wall biosynthesis [Kibdelosporangium banguiense]
MTATLRIALISEGAYPFHPGGVSLWCDQLINGMPEHKFTAVALTVDGSERSTWPAPANLDRIVNLPLWGRAPEPKRTRRRDFDEIHQAFLESLTPPGDPDALLRALRPMFEFAQTADLRKALLSNEAIDRLLTMWTAPLTLRDALTVADLIEHMLRPLSYPPIEADISHLSMNGLSALVAMCSKWTYGTPILMSEHGVYLRERYLGIVNEPSPHAVKVLLLSFFRALAGAAYRESDMLAPHSSYNRRWQLHNGADEQRMRTMYNGIDPADFPPVDSEPDQPTVVFVGRIDPLKDLHTLIRAFQLVRKEIPDARLRMFGPVTPANENYHASCVKLIAELGLTDCAVFEGRVPRQIDAYHAGHLVALTSVSEGFPFTVVESMSAGRPQVCTNVGGVCEAVGDAGFVVPPRDHAAVAQACVKLLKDTPLRRKLGLAARQRVLENFTLQKWNDTYRGIYTELVTR